MFLRFVFVGEGYLAGGARACRAAEDGGRRRFDTAFRPTQRPRFVGIFRATGRPRFGSPRLRSATATQRPARWLSAKRIEARWLSYFDRLSNRCIEATPYRSPHFHRGRADEVGGEVGL